MKFDEGEYLRKFPHVQWLKMTAEEHYQKVGKKLLQGISINSVIQNDFIEFKKENHSKKYVALKEEVEKSGLFNRGWYLDTYSDIKAANIDPLEHFINTGSYEGRNPGPLFDTAYYIENYSDVSKSGMSPIEHYIYVGREKGYVCKPIQSYERWLQHYDDLNQEDVLNIESDLDSLSDVDLIYICIGNNAPADAKPLSESVYSQIYNIKKFINISKEDDVKRLFDGDVSDSTIFIIATPSLVLRSHVSYVLSKVLKSSLVGAVYCDHDHIDADGRRFDPVFKPAMSPELLLRAPYQGPMIAVKASSISKEKLSSALILAVEDINKALSDILIAVTLSQIVLHIPIPLFSIQSDIYSLKDQENIVSKQILVSKKIDTVKYNNTFPKVDIIIPTRDLLETLRECINSIVDKTSYPPDMYKIIVVDNDSSESGTLSYFSELESAGTAKIIPSKGAFNFSKICNDGVKASGNEVLVFLNNDVSVLESHWLSTLVANACREDIGLVGARLLYPDHSVQHGGVVVGYGGVAAHSLVGMLEADVQKIDVTREISAITGACFAVRRSVFDELSCFDETLGVAFNDVDLCLKAIERGYKNLYIAESLFIHHESKSRGLDNTRQKQIRNTLEAIYIRRKHADRFKNDPYYSPNLSFEHFDTLAFPPRVTRPWRRSKNCRKALILLPDQKAGSDIDLIVEIQAQFLHKNGWSVCVGGPARAGEREYENCTRVIMQTAEAAAQHAIEGGFDCIIIHGAPFYRITKYLPVWPLVYVYDHGMSEFLLSEDYEARQNLELEKRFGCAVVKRTFVASQSAFEQQYDSKAIVLKNGNDHLATWSENWKIRREEIRKKLNFTDKFVVLNVCYCHNNMSKFNGVENYTDLSYNYRYFMQKLTDDIVFIMIVIGNEGEFQAVKNSNIVTHFNVSDEQLAEFYAVSDVYVDLSQVGGCGLGLEQALAMGLDVIAWEIPAHREIDVRLVSSLPQAYGCLNDLFGNWLSGNVQRRARIQSWNESLGQMLAIIEADIAEAGSDDRLWLF